MQCVAVCCSALQCVAVCCSVLQPVAACCSLLQLVAAETRKDGESHAKKCNGPDETQHVHVIRPFLLHVRVCACVCVCVCDCMCV